MSYIDVLNDAAARADAASTKATGASDLLHDIVNGPEETFVTTDNGPVPTAATAIADLQSQITAGTLAPISESVTLNAGQTNVTFNNIQTSGISVYVDEGNGAYRYFTFTVDGTNTIVLDDTFPAGTLIWGLSQEIGGEIGTAVDQTQANAQLAEDWAIKLGATVDGTEFSSKYHAQQSASSASEAQTAELVAEDWASKTIGTVDGTEYSSKYYSQQSSSFADNSSASASAASTSETNAANSESAAATSETNAANSASAASTSENNAAASETNAANSASDASTSATNAAASYDQFDDRYLGSKASAPTTDNDGDPILTGAIYWDTTFNALQFWNGSAWEFQNSDNIAYDNNSSNFVSTNVQDALDEVGTVAFLDTGTAGAEVRTNTENETYFSSKPQTLQTAEEQAILFAIALG